MMVPWSAPRSATATLRRRQCEPNAEHYCQAYDLWTGFEVSQWGAFGFQATSRARLALL